jgi:hypothetical protein
MLLQIKHEQAVLLRLQYVWDYKFDKLNIYDIKKKIKVKKDGFWLIIYACGHLSWMGLCL